MLRRPICQGRTQVSCTDWSRELVRERDSVSGNRTQKTGRKNCKAFAARGIKQLSDAGDNWLRPIRNSEGEIYVQLPFGARRVVLHVKGRCQQDI